MDLLSRTLALPRFRSRVARRLDWLVAPSVPLLAAAAMWLGGPAPTARADEVFSNFDPDGAFHPGFNSVAASARGAGSPFGARATRFAAAFHATGSDFTLDLVTLPLSQAVSAGIGDFLVVRLAAEAPGGLGMPGATIEVLSMNQPVPQFANPFTTTVTFNSITHPRLIAGVHYFIVTELSEFPTLAGAQQVDFRWYLNTSGTTVPAWQQQSQTLPTDPWDGVSQLDSVAFRIDGTPIIIGACCNPATGTCAIVEAASCQSLGLRVIDGVQTCDPSPCDPPRPADFDGDGVVNVQDIFDFLAAWFGG